MDKKQKNKQKNKQKKQQAAVSTLMEARELSPILVVERIMQGNQFVRQVVTGNHLADGVEQFLLNEDEKQLLHAAEEALLQLARNPAHMRELKKTMTVREIHRRVRDKQMWADWMGDILRLSGSGVISTAKAGQLMSGKGS